MNIFTALRGWAKQFKRDDVTLWFACRHPLTPWYAKALGGFVVAYALSPIDLIPDFIPVLGYVDDVLLLPGLPASPGFPDGLFNPLSLVKTGLD